jgi:putative DNA methylase
VEDGDRYTNDGTLETYPVKPVLLETWFPSCELSLIIARDRRARDPAYTIHRWWARRPAALIRALLISSILPASTAPEVFWEHFANEGPLLEGLRVYDPFAGGGSTLIEAARLGAHVSGGDIDPVAVRIIGRVLDPADPTAVRKAGAEMVYDLRHNLAQFYPSFGSKTPLHYFSIAEVTCPSCGKRGSLYRNLILVRDLQKPGAVVRNVPLTVFCPLCFRLHDLNDPNRMNLRCCGRYHRIDSGTFAGHSYRCPHCGVSSTHRDLRTGVAPRQLIAVEEVIPGARRQLRSPSKVDLDSLSHAAATWKDERHYLPCPAGLGRIDRHDERPRSYGIERYEDMFTPRQLLALGRAFKWVREANLTSDVRDALELAVSNALITNNRLCGYATDYGRLSGLFTVRGYSLPALSVELNPLHPSGGRGSFAACIEWVARSAEGEVRRYVWSPRMGKAVAQRFLFTRNGAEVDLAHRDATNLPSSENGARIDIAVFDPPYFDYIAYDELSEFHRAWLCSSDLAGRPLLPHGANRAEEFGERLGKCLWALQRRMRAGRPLAFTYRGTELDAWQAIGIALDRAALRVTALWPVRSDGHMGHHSYPGNSEWDIIVVCRSMTDTTLKPLSATIESWVKALHPIQVNDADRANFHFAMEMAMSRFGAPKEETRR